ncbi:MAG: OsmC family protein [Planctomycetota bacterium]|nr:OsmC family protein [Planctomycetota bacterium]
MAIDKHQARITWALGQHDFLNNQYSREHTWSFDDGLVIPASSSPGVVPLPWSAENAIDPEEALVASASSCHMLWFLDLARQDNRVVEYYSDQASGRLGKDSSGRIAITSITLRPEIRFSANQAPSAEELAELHSEAHRRCFIANTLKCPVHVEPPCPEEER